MVLARTVVIIVTCELARTKFILTARGQGCAKEIILVLTSTIQSDFFADPKTHDILLIITSKNPFYKNRFK